MLRKTGASKFSFMVITMAVLSVLLIGRLMMLTVLQGEKWTSYAEDMSRRLIYETAPRGDILDRNGNIIATSRAVYSVIINRVNLDKETALDSSFKVMNMLKNNGEDISVTQQEVEETLGDNSYNAYMPIVLAEDVNADTASKIEDSGYPGIGISKNYIREYPNGSLASHVIGYLGRISESEEEEYVDGRGYRIDALIGKSGIEKVCEDTLKGRDAVSTLQVDSGGNVTGLIDESKSQKGKDVQLTIDLPLQKTTEAALKQALIQSSTGGTFVSEYGNYNMVYADNAASGAAVALDVKTGKVLAMASYPDFYPQDFAVSISTKKWAALQPENENDPLSPSPLYNVATMTAVAPGSTFKPVTALAALSCGLDKDRYLYDDGVVNMGDRTFGCSLWNDTGATHGYVSLYEAMGVSCNYYFYDIATGMDLASDRSLNYDKTIDNEDILRFAHKMGLGEKTGIEIGESSGTLPSEQLKTDSVRMALKRYLTEEGEEYFVKKVVYDEKLLNEITEKISNWIDKDLTLEEIIGKLKETETVKKDKIRQLAEICKYSYFSQARWTTGDTFNISIGQGDNSYTTLQMANYMAALGNGGVRNDVTLFNGEEKITGGSKLTKEKADDEPETNPEHLEWIIDAMTRVTSHEGGSLYRAFGDFPYPVAAKTGTAQREGYDNFAWTVALAPADDPEIAVAVMLVQGKTSSNAAPVAREIIGRYGEISGWEK